MKINIGWTVLYVTMVALLTLTMMDPEEQLMKDWAMCIAVIVLYALFMKTWLALFKRTVTNFTVHKWLYAGITWYALLTVGEILFMQWTINLAVISGMLIVFVVGLLLNRQNANIVDGLMAGGVLLVLYAAMQFEHTILPGGILGGMAITLLFIIGGALRDWQVTLWLARGIFFFIVIVEFYVLSPWPFWMDYGYFLYILLALFIVAYVVGRRIKPILLPQKWMPWIIGLTSFVLVLKLWRYFV